jgi:PIN domain nuclease of toxin-antitoxin system
MDKTIQIQTQIRHNAEEISAALSEMGKWEKQMKNRDGNIKTAHQKAARVPRAPIRSGVGTVPVQVNDIVKEKPSQGKLACFEVTLKYRRPNLSSLLLFRCR